MQEYFSKSIDDTFKFAKEFVKTLSAGDIVLLDGDLGAGKTTFVKGIVSSLSNGKITAVSPTFVTMNVYETTPKIFHFDLYRILDADELLATGAEEYLFSDGISFVEWPSRIENFFPENSIKVYIKKVGENERIFQIERKI